MKKTIFVRALFALVAVTLLSWGVTGHRTCGRIAENHLSPAAKAAIHDLLGDESLADASTWADEVRSQPEFKNNGPWHYIDIARGMSFDEFSAAVKGTFEPNAYWAVLQMENDLTSPTTTREQKVVALKYIVHIVEDLHQPFHVGNTEDKGGNTIQVNYNGQGTNLHALWDSKLIDHGGLNDEQLAAQYDNISPEKIKEWQSASMLQWIWESYQLSTQLYAEIDQMKSRSISDAYYEARMPIVKERIQMAGIRLAGLLNELFSGHFKPNPIPVVNPPKIAIDAAPAMSASGAPTGTSTPATTASTDTASVTVCDKVYGGKTFSSGMALLNLGGAYPDQKWTIVIKAADHTKFKDAPDVYYDGKKVCVTGHTEMYKGKPEIIVTDPSQIKEQ